MESKTLTIRLNEDQIPIIPPRPDAHLTFAIHNDGNELELTGNRAGLLLLAKAALGMAETLREDGFHIHLDDLYALNAEGKTIIIRKERALHTAPSAERDGESSLALSVRCYLSSVCGCCLCE